MRLVQRRLHHRRRHVQLDRVALERERVAELPPLLAGLAGGADARRGEAPARAQLDGCVLLAELAMANVRLAPQRRLLG